MKGETWRQKMVRQKIRRKLQQKRNPLKVKGTVQQALNWMESMIGLDNSPKK